MAQVGHLLGFEHCVFFRCCMNGSGHLAEDFAQVVPKRGREGGKESESEREREREGEATDREAMIIKIIEGGRVRASRIWRVRMNAQGR